MSTMLAVFRLSWPFQSLLDHVSRQREALNTLGNYLPDTILTSTLQHKEDAIYNH